MQIRRHEKPFPYVVAWAIATLAAFAGTGRLSIGQTNHRPTPAVGAGTSIQADAGPLGFEADGPGAGEPGRQPLAPGR